MKPIHLLGVAVLCFVMFAFLHGCGNYNSFVSADESAKEAWGNVQTQYQRRADLIPNLVSTVQGYATFEKSTLEAVVEARAKATQPQISLEGVDFKSITPEQFSAFQSAQQNLSGSLARLLAVVEAYPELKANENFRDLQQQLEGTENRIAVARDEYNAVVRPYNQKVRKFPATIWAKLFGFEPLHYFEATEGAEKAPEVKFG